MSQTFSELVRLANEELSPQKTKVVGSEDGEKPRFELYHATFSVCSHKVRTVLFEKGIPFTSHQMNLVVSDSRSSDSYKPAYMRMRMLGAPDANFVSGYTGQSSMATEGFDPCVVPTLVDHLHERIIVDSARICDYLEQEVDPGTLLPSSLADELSKQIALIDEAPHVALLYGALPDGKDQRPPLFAKALKGVHDHKLRYLKELKDAAAGDEQLVAAYEAKITKESSAKGFIYDRNNMIDALSRMQDHVTALETQLSKHDGQWAMGDEYTMADIMWTISLFRLKWLGLGYLWENADTASRVSEYVKHAFTRPGFVNAVVEWPLSTPPSKHIPGTAGFFNNVKFVFKTMQQG